MISKDNYWTWSQWYQQHLTILFHAKVNSIQNTWLWGQWSFRIYKRIGLWSVLLFEKNHSPRELHYSIGISKQLQVILFQKLLFLHQLTQNVTAVTKGQIISEWLYDVILTIFCSYFGGNDDFITSFWNYLTFSYCCHILGYVVDARIRAFEKV